jgi:pimeloyl-ACP methyl ester carboxylesterase
VRGRRTAATALVLAAAAGCSASSDRESPPTRPPASAATAGATASPSSAPTADLSRFYTQRPRWTGCGDRFECTRVRVPLDYADPTGRTIEISVNRLPARGGRRTGSLVLNPGGPGASGLDYARAATSVVSGTVRQRFDIVGFDPRGVGESTPVRCLDDKETDTYLAADGSPDTAAEERRLAELSEAFGRRCAERSGALLAHVGTRDAARDLDVLRAVLGDAKLTYLGKSYGTYLGATYAELFPSRVGALVLDGALDPSLTNRDFSREQARGFETALRAFVDDCRRRSDCPLPAARDRALDRVAALLRAIDRRPLSGDRGRRVTEGLAVIGVLSALYDEQLWPLLRDALAEAQGGSGETLLLLADFYTDRDENGHYTNNSNDAIYAVSCLDRPEDGDVDSTRAAAAEFRRVAPRFGTYLAWSGLPCATWPYPAQGPPRRIAAAGARPILVVGTTRDPATPYAWSRALADQLESGRLLTYDGDGHTAYRRGSACIDRAVDAYLMDGTLPRDGTRCA